MVKHEWSTKWTGDYPCLCHGEWVLYKNGVLVNTDIPFQGSPANTYGSYQEWFFAGEDYEEDWDEYEDGETEAQWCANNRQWLETLADADEWPDIYAAFQENDWRHNSCGGCI